LVFVRYLSDIHAVSKEVMQRTLVERDAAAHGTVRAPPVPRELLPG
jgi:hypothetical protein